MKKGKILVVGGYGGVGRVISTALGKKFPGQVIAAGRSYQKSEELSLETKKQVLPRELDVFSGQEHDEVLSDVTLVVMCIDQRDTKFIEKCFRKGINYIDITATYEIISKIELLNDVAREHNATAVLSVGLSPGLTNILAAYGKTKLDEMKQVDMFIMGGLGEVHGEGTMRWLIETMNSEYSILENGVKKSVRSFVEGKRTIFPENFGCRTAYRYDFSDQHILPKSMGLDSASTWVCYDSKVMTGCYAFLAKIGVFKILRFQFSRDIFLKVLKTFHWGSDIFIIKTEARGLANLQQSVFECSISGNNEERATGLFAADVAERLYTGQFFAGVFHSEQLFEPLEFIEEYCRHGFRFHHSERVIK